MIFGVNSSPFVLNGTLDYHISKYFEADPEFARKLLEALYVEELSSGDNTVNSCLELYKKTVNCFHSGGFQLHKWASNSQDLMRLIESDQNSKRPDEPQPKTKFGSLENEQSFVKLSIEGADKLDLDYDEGKPTKVLGITWDCESDQLIFDLKALAEFGKSLKPTKRNLLRLTAKLFDPLVLLSPIIFTLKLMFQSTCVNKYK